MNLLDKPEYFFVYGTLKSGYGNNRLLENSQFVDDAVSKNTDFVMQCNGAFPMVKKSNDLDQSYGIIGEIYKVNDFNTIMDLDRLESNGFMYNREEHDFVLINKVEVVKAWIYLYISDFFSFSTMKYFAKEYSHSDKNLTFAPYLWQDTQTLMCEWHRDY